MSFMEASSWTLGEEANLQDSWNVMKAFCSTALQFYSILNGSGGRNGGILYSGRRYPSAWFHVNLCKSLIFFFGSEETAPPRLHSWSYIKCSHFFQGKQMRCFGSSRGIVPCFDISIAYDVELTKYILIIRAKNVRFYTCKNSKDVLPQLIMTFARQQLVGGLEHVLFFHTLGISSSQLTNSYFPEGFFNHQPVIPLVDITISPLYPINIPINIPWMSL